MDEIKVALPVVPQPQLIEAARSPEEIVAEATERADVLRRVVEKAGLAIYFDGGEHLQLEAWQTIGRFYGVTAKVVGTGYVEYDGASGWEAAAIVIRLTDGLEISRAEAMCLNDEDNWSSRPKYDWVYCLRGGGRSVEDPGPDNIIWEDNPNKPGKKRPKKERISAGETRVPLYQLRSMAQTRACSKALRNALSWVVVLAGYKATPAEEMDGEISLGTRQVESLDEVATMKCPDCGGAMWDNRATKTGRQPSFKCKNEKCGKAVWVSGSPKKEKTKKTEEPQGKHPLDVFCAKHGLSVAQVMMIAKGAGLDVKDWRDLTEDVLTILDNTIPDGQVDGEAGETSPV